MKNILLKSCGAISILFIGICIVSCGKKKYPPEYFYHDSNVIELCNAITKQDEHKIDELLKQNTDIKRHRKGWNDSPTLGVKFHQ